MADETHYLRTYLRKNLEKDPRNPEYILSERRVATGSRISESRDWWPNRKGGESAPPLLNPWSNQASFYFRAFLAVTFRCLAFLASSFGKVMVSTPSS